MKKVLISVLLLIFISPACFPSTFKDLDEKHWAASSVEKLIKLGVTEGYPDGTFRGTNQISRYESAVLMGLLASRYNLDDAIREKLIEELRAEVRDLKNDFTLIKKSRESAQDQFYGSFTSRFRFANVGFKSDKSILFDYRLKTTFFNDFGQGVYGKIVLDTTDAGFGGGNRKFSSSLIDVEGGVRFDIGSSPIKLKANISPGIITHRDTSGLIPSEDYTIFIKPKSSFEFSTSAGNIDAAALYVTRCVSISGEVGVNEFTGILGYTFHNVPLFSKLRFTIQPRFLYSEETDEVKKDSRMEFGICITPSDKIKSKILYGIGPMKDQDDSFYYYFDLELNDPWASGTTFILKAHKVGLGYRVEDLDKYEFIPLNMFDRLVVDGTSDLALKIVQKLSPSLSIYFKGDIALTEKYKYGEDYPGTYLIFEEGLIFAIAKNVDLTLSYKRFDLPSGEDQFTSGVAKSSDIASFGLTYSF